MRPLGYRSGDCGDRLISEWANLVQIQEFREALEGAMLGYLPDLSKDATQLVLKQAELSAGGEE